MARFMPGHATSFNITNAKEFLGKLHEEQKDFIASRCLSGRHALNAIITAYHLHEWVWGEWLQNHHDLRKAWGVNSADDFRQYLSKRPCPAFKAHVTSPMAQSILKIRLKRVTITVLSSEAFSKMTPSTLVIFGLIGAAGNKEPKTSSMNLWSFGTSFSRKTK
jgi:hypothetical protein